MNGLPPPAIESTGIYDISEKDYHADPISPLSASCSVLQILDQRSPLHAMWAHPRMHPHFEKNDPKFDMGSAFHKIMLGKGREIVPLNFPDWRTKEARAQRDAVYAAGKIPMKTDDLATAQRMAEEANSQIIAHEGWGDSTFDAEKTLAWEEDGFWFRIRPDMMCLAEDIIGDLKATDLAASPDSFSRHIYSMGYDFRAAFYARGYRAVTGRPLKEYRFIACEVEPPHALGIFALTPQAMDFAAKNVERAIAVWKDCLTKNEWPGYSKKICYVDPPRWVENKQIQREISEIKD